MPTLRDIKRRIRSVKSTQQITNAMKMIAGARLRRAQERMLAMRPYVKELGRILAGILPELAGREHALMERRPEVKRLGLVVVTPDRGLCGGLPGSLIRRARRELDEASSSGQEVVLFPAGRKGIRAGASAGVEVGFVAEVDSERPAPQAAEKLAAALVDAFTKGSIDAAKIVFAEFRSAAAQRIRSLPLLPVARESLVKAAEADAHEVSEDGVGEKDDGERDERDREEEMADQFAGAELEPSVSALADAAIQRHVGATIYGALLEGAASELGARLTAMDAATRNAGDLIFDLTLSYNKARQAMITKEIMDIVGGVEALR
jgi:F-type H+-transporting ATPase subunit gamma